MIFVGAEIHHRLSAQEGNGALQQQIVYEWLIKIKNGCLPLMKNNKGACTHLLQRTILNKSMP
jgi:hypothetical protein